MRAVADGDADAVGLRRQHGRDARGRAPPPAPAARRDAARDRRADPGAQGPSVLLDAGANADARPEHLLQFAHMGAVFSEELLDVHPRGAAPLDRRGGREGEPADDRGAPAAPRGQTPQLRGNAESRDLLRGAADVVVTDGFTGNIALKLLEGTISELLDALREEIAATATGKLGGVLIRPAAQRLRKRLDPDTYGGAYLLGLKGLAVIAHGNSRPSGDRECDPAGRPGRREPRGRAARGAAPRARRCMIARFFAPHEY